MYQPQTRWIGGEYPGAILAHYHQVKQKKVRPQMGHKRRAIVDCARENDGVSAIDIAYILTLPIDSVREEIRARRAAKNKFLEAS